MTVMNCGWPRYAEQQTIDYMRGHIMPLSQQSVVSKPGGGLGCGPFERRPTGELYRGENLDITKRWTVEEALGLGDY